MPRLHCLSLAALLACALPACAQPPKEPKQWGIVVGIDHYGQAAHLTALQGAVNDAELLKTTLRGIGVELPDSRVLLNRQATRANFLAAWADTLKQARPGERIIISFAGHGSHEADREPFDEADGQDETLLFYDYDRAVAGKGRVFDDELFAQFERAGQYAILFVSDSCHAGGLTRSASLDDDLLPTRDGDSAFYAVNLDAPSPKPVGVAGDQRVLAHVTHLLAMEDEAQTIREILAPGQTQVHGALSLAFAEAVGQRRADQNRDGVVSREELAAYVENRVPQLSKHQQTPLLMPRGDSGPALSLDNNSPPPPAASPQALPVKLEGGSLPPGVGQVRISDNAYRLRLIIGGGKAKAYNRGGDFVGEIPAADAGAWNSLFDKYRFLDALDANPQWVSGTVQIHSADGRDGKLYARGTQNVAFDFTANASHSNFVLLDLQGDGSLKFLYPLQGDESAVKTPYPRKFNVVDPLGEDNMVALFCAQPNAKLVELLRHYDGKNAPPAEVFLNTAGPACQIGKYAFMTVPKL